MTVYKISKSTKIIDGVLRAKKSYPYKIYKQNYIKGKIEIPLTFKPKTVGTKLLLFYGIDAGGIVDPSCGGESVLVSDTEGIYFDSCTASSSFSDG